MCVRTRIMLNVFLLHINVHGSQPSSFCNDAQIPIHRSQTRNSRRLELSILALRSASATVHQDFAATAVNFSPACLRRNTWANEAHASVLI
ncbi:hypothetical protein BD289DRAFT_426691 [Coniella lustricola]|uniref:Secreted protein n=1 Tax=Coniella lustricola TaxID=2025994 RepID=A0A2T3AFZ2_9PEZI|nr:hypothetical protein BD289DRAFT_426691 [Coniella lustricola]